MSNRFHNKYHRHSHHTSPVSGDTDIALDPIASSEHPFMGRFNIVGDLILSGDLIADGDIYMNNYPILNCDATTTKYGVVRIATDLEASERIRTDCVVNPKQLSELAVEVNINNTPHKLMSNIHSDIELDEFLSDGEILYYQDGNWTNAAPTGIYSRLATYNEASGGESNDVAITQEQLHTEIRRNKPIYVSNATPNAIDAVFASMSVDQTSVSEGTLVFTNWVQRVVVGWGNGATATDIPSVAIWKYSNGSWARVY